MNPGPSGRPAQSLLSTLHAPYARSFRLMLWVTGCILLGAGRLAAAASGPTDADIEFLLRKIQATHPDRDAPEFVAKLRKASLVRPPENDPDKRIVYLARLLAAAESSATYVYLFQDRVGYTVAPVHAYDFDDGLQIMAAVPDLNQLVGGRVVALAGRPIEDVRSAVYSTISAEYDSRRRYLWSRRAFSPELLYGLGLTGQRTEFSVTVQKTDGSTVSATLKGSRDQKWTAFYARSGRRVPSELQDRHFWVRVSERQQAIVAEIRQIRDEKNGEGLESFANALAATLSKYPRYRLILDLRYGGGGSGHSMGPLVDAVAHSPQSIETGEVFALIGRLTAGTVLEFASVLRNRAPVVFIGEPASMGPNDVGDPIRTQLPDSEISVAITEVKWPTTLPEEDGRPVQPDIRVAVRGDDYRAGRDRALSVALISKRTLLPKSRSVATPANASGWTAMYAVGDRQSVKIYEHDGRLWFRLDDAAGWVGRNFIGAQSPLFVESEDTLLTHLRGVSIVRNDGTFSLRWRGHERPMIRTVWTWERKAIAVTMTLLAGVGLLLAWGWRRRSRAKV